MLWSLGTLVLVIDIWRRLELGGIDLVYDNKRATPHGKGNRLAMPEFKNEYHNMPSRSIGSRNSSNMSTFIPVGIADIAKRLNWKRIQEALELEKAAAEASDNDDYDDDDDDDEDEDANHNTERVLHSHGLHSPSKNGSSPL